MKLYIAVSAIVMKYKVSFLHRLYTTLCGRPKTPLNRRLHDLKQAGHLWEDDSGYGVSMDPYGPKLDDEDKEILERRCCERNGIEYKNDLDDAIRLCEEIEKDIEDEKEREEKIKNAFDNPPDIGYTKGMGKYDR